MRGCSRVVRRRATQCRGLGLGWLCSELHLLCVQWVDGNAWMPLLPMGILCLCWRLQGLLPLLHLFLLPLLLLLRLFLLLLHQCLRLSLRDLPQLEHWQR